MLREMRDWAEELACRAGFDGLPSGGRAVAYAAVAVAVCVAAWLWWSPSGSRGSAPTSASASTASSAPSSSEDASESAAPAVVPTVTVQVVGEVRHPGVYELHGGARAIDAVSAAGGLLGDADQAAVNLARVVADGEQIAVPREGEGGASAGADGAGAGAASGVAGGKVDLNTATAEQLDALPGIGPATAAKIVADRTNNGPFRKVEDLMRVPGIGPAKMDALKDLVTAG